MTEIDPTASRNHSQAALADVASKVLWMYPWLPDISTVQLGTTLTGGRDKFRTIVALQLASSAKAPASAMAAWAVEFKDDVHYADKGQYLESWTEAVVDGVTVMVWDHVRLDQVFAIRDRIGVKSFADMAAVDPQLLLGGDL